VVTQGCDFIRPLVQQALAELGPVPSPGPVAAEPADARRQLVSAA